MHIKIIRK